MTMVKHAWEPIADAPRTGHWIMAQERWADKWTGRMQYRTYRAFWSKDDGAWLRGARLEDYRHCSPNRWRPLRPGEH